MEKTKHFTRFDLQLFAEGASSGSGGIGGSEAGGASGVTAAAAGPQSKGVKETVSPGIKPEGNAAQAASAQNGESVQKDPAIPSADRQAEFEKLIKGEYKDLYNARMQDTLRKRLQATNETVEKYNSLSPALDMLSKKYGIDASNVKELVSAIEEDDSYYEQEAMEKGISVEHLKTIRKMERENTELRRQMQEKETRENASRLYASWMDQAERVKGVYPSFNLESEMQNPKFIDLLRSNIDVRTAYEVLHKDEIIPAAMQFTAKTVEQKLTNKIIAGSARPDENGIESSGAAVVKRDVSKLSDDEMDDIIRRVQQGERVILS